MIVVKTPNFHHDISTLLNSCVKAINFMNHIARILSSNEFLDITQCKFNIKIFSIPHGTGKSKFINFSTVSKTK